MTEQGWIKLHRKLQKSDMYKSLNAVQRDVLINCLLLANHETHKWEWNGKLFEIKSGQFITSLNSLKDVCAKDVSIQNIRTSIDKLEKWQFLTNRSTKTGRLITIENWGKYQGGGGKVTKKLTVNQQRTNKELTTNKNDKNEKNEKNKSKSKNPYIKKQAKKVLEAYNEIYDRQLKSTRAIESNLEYWLEDYSVDDIVRAFRGGRKDKFYRDKLTPAMLLRRRDTRGDDVDRIAELMVKAVNEVYKTPDGKTFLDRKRWESYMQSKGWGVSDSD